jgi:16S rRNA (uracil1498-N3)-methyltransferase
MSDRYFVPPISGDSVLLTGDEAHHLVRVCRLRPGDSIVVFDGSGMECDAEVLEVRRREVVLAITARREVSRELPFALTLGCCLPKGDRARWLVEKATELGVTRFVPLRTERASESARGQESEKLRRWVIEASKQCGRNVLMEVAQPTDWSEFLDAVPSDSIRWLASRAGSAIRDQRFAACEHGVAIAVGPEGGFSNAEESLAIRRGWAAVSLGPRVLRVETAALAMLACATV